MDSLPFDITDWYFTSASHLATACAADSVYCWYCVPCICLYSKIIIRSVAAGFGRHSMPPPAANDTGTSFTAFGRDGSDWSRDLATLTFDLGGHDACGWYGSSSSYIRMPSLKFIGLAVWKRWRTMCVSVNGPGDLDFWPFDLETGMRVASMVGNLHSEFRHSSPSGCPGNRYVHDGRADERTKSTLVVIMFPPYGREHNNNKRSM